MSNFKKFEDEIEIQGNINLNNQEIFKDQRIEGNASIENENNKNNNEENNKTNPSSGFINWIIARLNFVGKYFNVEIDDIKDKFIFSLIPLKKGFNEVVENSPDLYGPFWLYTTLIFIVGVTSNISGYLNVRKNK